MKRIYLIYALLCCILTSVGHAVVVSYYRFEEDLDGDLTNDQVITPSEIAGQPHLISSSARIDFSGQLTSLPNDFVPNTGEPNRGSLDGRNGGSGGNPDINATVAYTSDLDIDSMTVEMWVRSEEQMGTLISRTTTADVVDSSISDGYRIYNPSSLDVEFWTHDGSGGNLNRHVIDTNVQLDNVGSRGDGLTNWRHLAFVYDDVTGLGELYLDSVVIGTASVSAGDVLYWGGIAAEPIMQVGVDMDGYNFSKDGVDDGYIDEIRISSVALDEDDFLTSVPEPSSFALLAGLAAMAHCLTRRRGKKVA